MPTLTIPVNDLELLGLTRLAREDGRTVEDHAALALASYIEARKVGRGLSERDSDFLHGLRARFADQPFTAAQAAEFVMPGVKLPGSNRSIMAGHALTRLGTALADSGSSVRLKRYTMGSNRRLYCFTAA